MSEEFGPTFITVTDEDGKELVLEFVDALEYNGQMYQAFFPAETEDENEDDPDNGLVILKVIHEDGEDMLSTLDSDEELEAEYAKYAEQYKMDVEKIKSLIPSAELSKDLAVGKAMEMIKETAVITEE